MNLRKQTDQSVISLHRMQPAHAEYRSVPVSGIRLRGGRLHKIRHIQHSGMLIALHQFLHFLLHLWAEQRKDIDPAIIMLKMANQFFLVGVILMELGDLHDARLSVP